MRWRDALARGSQGNHRKSVNFHGLGSLPRQAPLLLAPGGNAYHPHAFVWEAHEDADIQAWIAAVELRMKDARLGVT
jgi:hypothetical protein